MNLKIMYWECPINNRSVCESESGLIWPLTEDMLVKERVRVFTSVRRCKSFLIRSYLVQPAAQRISGEL